MNTLVQLSKNTVKVHWRTGVVVGTPSPPPARIHAHGAPVPQPSVPSRVLLLEDDAGQHHPVAMSNWRQLGCVPGQRLTVVWPIREGDASGRYALVHNHSTGISAWHDRAIQDLCRPRLLHLLRYTVPAAALVGALAGDLAGAALGALLGAPLAWLWQRVSPIVADETKLKGELGRAAGLPCRTAR